MMKWKKGKASSSSSSSSSSHQSLITHVFPASWFSKFKQKNTSSHQQNQAVALKTDNQKAVSSPSLSVQSARLKVGRFYSTEDDPYWRLSFSEDRVEARSFSSGSINELEAPFSRTVRAEAMEKARRDESWKFDNRVNGKMAKSLKDEKLRNLSRKALEERLAEMEIGCNEAEKITPKKMMEKDIFEILPEKDSRKLWSPIPNPSVNTVEEGDYMFQDSSVEEEKEFGSEQDQLEEIKMKTEQERKSIHIARYNQRMRRRRRKHGIKVGACSPRTTAKLECKVKALEDMRRTKKKMKEKNGNDTTAFDSFAVVKSSFNPEKDFKDSMIEMITQIGIKHPEELEELLACYLTLNCDQYHHIIIKVFRQVWFELNRVYVSEEIQNNLFSDDSYNLT